MLTRVCYYEEEEEDDDVVYTSVLCGAGSLCLFFLLAVECGVAISMLGGFV